MTLESVTEVSSDHIKISSSGEYSLEETLNLIERVASIASKTECARVLLDCRSITGSMTEAERFRCGQHIAETMGGSVRLAILMPAGQITKLGELAAINRGARVIVTPSETEAVSWLQNT